MVGQTGFIGVSNDSVLLIGIAPPHSPSLPLLLLLLLLLPPLLLLLLSLPLELE
jgi:hypothetical protein